MAKQSNSDGGQDWPEGSRTSHCIPSELSIQWRDDAFRVNKERRLTEEGTWRTKWSNGEGTKWEEAEHETRRAEQSTAEQGMRLETGTGEHRKKDKT